MQNEETLQSAYALFKSREKVYDGFYKKIFSLAIIEFTGMSAHVTIKKVFYRIRLKILTPKQILQRL